MTNDELIEKTDKAIHELVYPKYQLQKAYNYYNGIRDENQFKYLEESFGVSTPTAINFTPLLRKHVDALVGEYLSMPIIPKVSCKDSNTINNIYREKQLKINSELYNFLKNHLENTILNFKDGKDIEDSFIAEQMEKIVEDISSSFTSEYEIASQNVIDYIIQSRDTDFITCLRNVIIDLLITGYTFYKVEPSVEKNSIKIRVLNPLNTFIDRNIESPYVKNSYRAVVRSWMSKTEILNKYGKDMSKDDIKLLEDKWESVYDNSLHYIKMPLNKEGYPSTSGLMAGIETVPGYPSSDISKDFELVPVYEVEWLETDKDFVIQRYETIRIGDEIYILKGKNDKVIRSISNPNYCSLSINGVYFLNRGYEPYSLVLACTHLQDRYDLLCFYRDNIIANSGTIGDWIDETLIPAHLGVNMPERLTKWLQLKKQGIGLLNTAEEGRLASGSAPLTTIFNGYDDTVKTQAIQAIQLAIDSIEQTVSSITGVFRERLNGIEQRDAVSNVKQGVTNSFIITKQYYHQMDLIVNEMLLDCLNLAKVVFKKGLTGTLILGDKYQKIFTALPEYFTLTDHDIRIITTSDVVKDLEIIKAVIPEFVKSGGLPPDIIIEALTSKSIPELKQKIKIAMKKAKEENNQIQQLAQKAEQLEQELQKTTQELKQANSKIEQLNQTKLQLEQQELTMKNQLEWYKAKTDRQYKEGNIEEAKRRSEIEIAQLYDGNPYNDKIRQLGT